MDTMVKSTRLGGEVFVSGKDSDIFKAKTTTYYSSMQSSSSNATCNSPQLLGRQKRTNSIKNLNTVEHIELEELVKETASNDGGYVFNAKLEKPQKSLSIQADKHKINSKLLNNNNNNKKEPPPNILSSNSNTKLLKQKSEIQFSQQITAKQALDKSAHKKERKLKKNKTKDTKKKSNSAENSQSDMFNVNKPQLKRSDTNKPLGSNLKQKPILKVLEAKPKSPEKENLETIRWRYELDEPVEEAKRIEVYKQGRRGRYIEQRNKYAVLSSNSSSNFLPYLYYEMPEVGLDVKDKLLDTTTDNLDATLIGDDLMSGSNVVVTGRINDSAISSMSSSNN